MTPNKIFFDLYSTSGGTLPPEEYKKWYDYHDTVFIALIDCAIYTIVHRQVMFDKGINHGCFIEHYSYETPELVQRHALQFMKDHNLRRVDLQEFMDLEKENELNRVQKAFAYAEGLISKG